MRGITLRGGGRMEVAVRLDDANSYELYYRDDRIRPAGLIWKHQRPDGSWCMVDIPFRGHGHGGPEWSVVLEDPLTVTPALRCAACRGRLWLDGGKGRPA